MSELEWMPFRQAVSEVAEAYAKFMHCTPEAAVPDALEAVMRRAQNGICGSRAPRWILVIKEGETTLDSRDDTTGTDLPWEFWYSMRTADEHTTDWVAGEFTGTAKENDELPGFFALAVNVEVTRDGLPVIGSDHFSEAQPSFGGRRVSPAFTKAAQGRPTKWDWEGALCAIIAEANGLDGLPTGHGAQAEIGRRIAQWFRQTSDGEPSASQIGERAARVMAAIETHRK